MRSANTDTPDFEAELKRVVLEAFAEGASVDGEWELTSPPAEIPDWRVTIERADRSEEGVGQSEEGSGDAACSGAD